MSFDILIFDLKVPSIPCQSREVPISFSAYSIQKYLIFDLKVPSIPLQSSKAPVLFAATKGDARVQAAGFLRGPARACKAKKLGCFLNADPPCIHCELLRNSIVAFDWSTSCETGGAICLIVCGPGPFKTAGKAENLTGGAQQSPRADAEINFPVQ